MVLHLSFQAIYLFNPCLIILRKDLRREAFHKRSVGSASVTVDQWRAERTSISCVVTGAQTPFENRTVTNLNGMQFHISITKIRIFPENTSSSGLISGREYLRLSI
jgi:hypothetical protein